MKIPDEIWKLGQARHIARSERNFTEADRLRNQMWSLGWDVIDADGDFRIEPKVLHSKYSSSRSIKEIDCGEIAIVLIVDGFQEDAVKTILGVRAFSAFPIVVLCLSEVGPLEALCDEKTFVLHLAEPCGWGEAASALMKKIQAEYLVLMDPSTRFTGDAISPVLSELRKKEFAAVGWRGGLINVEDEWRTVDDKGAGEVDVLFSYFLAVDREAGILAGSFNPRAIYYRNADIEFSLKLRHSQGRLLQMDLPLEQDRHHGYHDVDPEFSKAQSKKNYDRILEHFRGKSAILSPRR